MEVFIDILTVNCGSSSLKFALYSMNSVESISMSGSFEKIGLSAGSFHVKSAAGNTLDKIDLRILDHESAIEKLFEWLETNHYPAEKLDAVGHRFVHGGVRFTKPAIITPEVLQNLKELIPLAPDHLPQEISTIEIIGKNHPGIEQILCFDTAFHTDMPSVARTFPLPRHLIEQGIIRYGFHGLSYEFIMEELKAIAGSTVAGGRIIIAHLGSGSSIAAVKNGKSLDTTMGFTPTGGLMMSTRSGDLDPGVILYLLQEKKLSPETISDILNKKAGLLGVSDMSSDMEELLAKQRDSNNAGEAIELFCYQAKKFLGTLTAVLGGLDTLVFTGGIGENAPVIRELICRGMEFMNINLDGGLNLANAPVISSENSSVTVRVIKTNEELMIARHTYKLINKIKEE
jgi:acetate kinase